MKVRYFYLKKFQDYNRDLKMKRGIEDLIKPEYYEILRQDTNTKMRYDEDIAEGALYGEMGIDGLNIDFNSGLRLDIPAGDWHVKISDYDSEIVFFDEDISDTRLVSFEKYYVHWQVDVSFEGKLVFSHTFDMTEQSVLYAIMQESLSEAIALLPYVVELRKKYNCSVTIYVPEYLREYVAEVYSDFPQVDEVTREYYATFYPNFVVTEALVKLVDARLVPMERMGGLELGLKTIAKQPKFNPTEPRRINERYVCIGVKAAENRMWLYPNGWETVIEHLRKTGYRVVGVDDIESVMDCANVLYHAEFFVGLGNGLSWLAYAVGCPVVMVNGFSQNWYEFQNPYRVANRFVCNGCWNYADADFKKVCPYHEGSTREFECQKQIHPNQVINAINRLIEDSGI